MSEAAVGKIENEHIRVEILRDPDSGLLYQSLKDLANGHARLAESVRSGTTAHEVFTPALTTLHTTNTSAEAQQIVLRGTVDTADCELTLTLAHGSRALRVDFSLMKGAARGVSLRYQPVFEDPDLAFAPHIRPNPKDVVGRWGMKSPVGILQQGSQMLAVLGDIAVLEAAEPDLPLVLEIDCAPAGASRPILGFGAHGHALHSVAYFESTEPGSEQPRGRIDLSFYVLIDAAAKPGQGFQAVAQLAWNLLPDERKTRPGLQTVGFDRYAEYGFQYARETLWSDFDGRRGAVTGGVKYPNDVWFQSLFNHFRSAIAFKSFGSTWNNAEVESLGDRVKTLALSSPQTPQGLFPTIFTSDIEQALRAERWHASGHWMDSTMVEHSMGKVIERNAVKLVDWENTYHLVDCSWHCFWLLQWFTQVEPDEELLSFARSYAEYLLGNQQPDGSFPSFIDTRTLRPSLTLRQNVGSAASGAFLAELYLVTSDVRYLEAAVKVADFVTSAVLPTRKWQDYEVSFDSQGRPSGFFDRHSGQYAQTTQGMMWTASMFQALTKALPDSGYGDRAEQVVDYLTLYQQLWNPPFLSVKTFGGFPVGNGHPAWNDARTPMIAQVLLQQYALGGRRDLLERGIAALQASLVMMFIPENAAVSAVAARGPLGHADEAYAGRGVDGPWCGFSYDFPVGAALTAFAMVRARHGDLFIDTSRDVAAGINGCVIEEATVGPSSIDVTLIATVEHAHPLRLKVIGIDAGMWRVSINETLIGNFGHDELDSGVDVPLDALPAPS